MTPIAKTSLVAKVPTVAKTLLASALLTAAVATPALADDYSRCGNVPRDRWMKIEQVVAKVSERGYEVRGISADDGCWEVKVRAKDGSRLELQVHPVTAEIVHTGRDD